MAQDRALHQDVERQKRKRAEQPGREQQLERLTVRVIERPLRQHLGVVVVRLKDSPGQIDAAPEELVSDAIIRVSAQTAHIDKPAARAPVIVKAQQRGGRTQLAFGIHTGEPEDCADERNHRDKHHRHNRHGQPAAGRTHAPLLRPQTKDRTAQAQPAQQRGSMRLTQREQQPGIHPVRCGQCGLHRRQRKRAAGPEHERASHAAQAVPGAAQQRGTGKMQRQERAVRA